MTASRTKFTGSRILVLVYITGAIFIREMVTLTSQEISEPALSVVQRYVHPLCEAAEISNPRETR